MQKIHTVHGILDLKKSKLKDLLSLKTMTFKSREG